MLYHAMSCHNRRYRIVSVTAIASMSRTIGVSFVTAWTGRDRREDRRKERTGKEGR